MRIRTVDGWTSAPGPCAHFLALPNTREAVAAHNAMMDSLYPLSENAPINTIYVRLSGGLIQWIGCDAETFARIGGKVDVTVLDGDNEGTPEIELARVEWGDGEVSFEHVYRETISPTPACKLPAKIDYPENRALFYVWRLPYTPPQEPLGLFKESELHREIMAPLSALAIAEIDSQGYAEINGFRVERDE